MTRTIRLHTFSSVKGGVGKSSLAVVLAKLVSSDGGRPVVIDADFTGTSLADGLPLCAPKLRRTDSAPLLTEPATGEFHTWQETRRQRSDRATGSADSIRLPPYLNDVLGYEPGLRPDAALWRHRDDDGVSYLPSSAILNDVHGALKWLDSERAFDWACRLAWLLDGLIVTIPNLTDVVVDLPPGVWGFAHAVMVLVSALESNRPMPDGYPPWHEVDLAFSVNPFLVVTPDANDLVPALEYYARTRTNVRALRPLLNRATFTSEEIARTVEERLGPPLSRVGLHRSLVPVAELQETIGKIFRDADVRLGELGPLRDALRVPVPEGK